MKSKEEISELAFKYSVENYTPLNKTEETDYIMRVTKLSFERGYTACQDEDRWISVDERLPELNKYVLGVFSTGSMGGYKISVRTTIMIDNTGRPNFSGAFDWTHVTHWMPIPKPPVK